MPVRRILGAGKTCGTSFWLPWTLWWWLSNPVFFTRTSCYKITHANDSYGACQGKRFNQCVSLNTSTSFLLFLIFGWLCIVLRIDFKLINMIFKVEQKVDLQLTFPFQLPHFWSPMILVFLSLLFSNIHFPWAVLLINAFLCFHNPHSKSQGKYHWLWKTLFIQSNLIALYSVFLLNLCTHLS